MKKSELIEVLSKRLPNLAFKDVERAVNYIVEQMSEALSAGDRTDTGNRIEIRGFGSFSLHRRAPHIGRNPKTGEAVSLNAKFISHFKPGKDLRNKVNAARKKYKIMD